MILQETNEILESFYILTYLFEVPVLQKIRKFVTFDTWSQCTKETSE
jgi:hypothetical protein